MSAKGAMRPALTLGVIGLVGAAVLRAQAPAAPISFTRTVFPIFEAAQCRGCHADDGVASATRLHFPEENASPDDIEAFGITLAGVGGPNAPAKTSLSKQPRHPP